MLQNLGLMPIKNLTVLCFLQLGYVCALVSKEDGHSMNTYLQQSIIIWKWFGIVFMSSGRLNHWTFWYIEYIYPSVNIPWNTRERHNAEGITEEKSQARELEDQQTAETAKWLGNLKAVNEALKKTNVLKCAG